MSEFNSKYSGEEVEGLLDEVNKGIPAQASDIGAAPASHKHIKSQITDFPTSMPASDVPNWAKQLTKPTYTASEVGALPTGGTAAAATKLATKRKILGIGYDGTNDVAGDISNVGDITFAEGVSGRKLKITKNGGFSFYASTATWATAFSAYNNNGGTLLGTIAGAYGGGDTLVYLYYGGTSTSPHMVIKPTGNVGIGLTAPTQKLHVNGNILATGTITPASDERLKDNIRKVNTEDIEHVEFREYEMNGRSKCGVIAQQVLEHRPDDVIVPESADEMMAVDYFSILSAKCALYEKMLKEMQGQIDELKQAKRG